MPMVCWTGRRQKENGLYMLFLKDGMGKWWSVQDREGKDMLSIIFHTMRLLITSVTLIKLSRAMTSALSGPFSTILMKWTMRRAKQTGLPAFLRNLKPAGDMI